MLRGFAKITRNLTEQRRMEELKHTSRRMHEFLAMLAHELRDPLTPLRNAGAAAEQPSRSPGVRALRARGGVS
nr:hypothetical protein [Azohydromonas australica]